MIRRLIILLLIVGCEPEPEDCAGVAGGDAYLNECNICINTSQGDIDYYNIFNNMNRPTDLFINQISNECEIFYDQLTATISEDIINIDDAYILIDGDISDNHILISAPHSQRTYRYNGDSCSGDLNEHCRDKYTGAIAQYLNQLMECSIIISKNKSDDPNYYDIIPEGTETPAFSDIVGEPLPYKQAIKDYLSTNNNIKMIIDLHGFVNTISRSDQNIEIGTMDSLSLNGNINYCLPHIVEEIFARHNISNINNNSSEFSSINQSTVTKYITKQISSDINRNYDAIQMEVESDYRGCDITNAKHLNFINAMIEIIYVLNQLYKL